MMTKEWKKFVDTEKDYSMEEAVEKYNEMVEFMRSKRARLVSTPQCERQPLENEYHLTEKEKQKYMVKYAMQRYTKESCEKIVMIIDTIYHWYDVSSEEAEKVFVYAEEKHVTPSEAIEKTIGGMGLEELAEFATEVYPKIKQIYDNTLLRTTANVTKGAMAVYSMVNVLSNVFQKEDSNDKNKES